MATAKKAATLRTHIGVILDEEATLEATRQIVLDALGAETARRVTCPDCGTEFRAKQPDLKKQVDTLIALLEQHEGKAGQQAPAELQVIIQRPPLG